MCCSPAVIAMAVAVPMPLSRAWTAASSNSEVRESLAEPVGPEPASAWTAAGTGPRSAGPVASTASETPGAALVGVTGEPAIGGPPAPNARWRRHDGKRE